MSSWARGLVEVRPAATGRWTTLRLLAPALVVVVGCAAAGAFEEGLLVALGASIAVFARGKPGPRRAGTLLCAALLLLGALCAGYLVADVFLTLILWDLVVAVLAAVVDVVLPFGAPGPWSLVLMVNVGSLLGMAHVGLGTVLGYVALGCVLGIAAGMGDLLYDGRRTVLLPPLASLSRRLRQQLARPWPAVAGLVEGYIAILLASTFTHATDDRHPFWPVLVVVLVLSAPADRRTMVRRAGHCLVGALLAVVVFAPLSQTRPPTALLAVLVCVLLWLVARLLARQDLAGSFAAALLGLVVTAPLLPAIGPVRLGLEHAADAAVAVALSLVMLRLLRPGTRIRTAASMPRGHHPHRAPRR